MNVVDQIIEYVNTYVVGAPLVVLIFLVGIVLTFRLGFLQLVRLPRALFYMWFNEKQGKGDVTSLGALCTALSATVGTGNIVGVATAIVAGGPGALFWMWLAAFFGMATKFAEGVLAVKYREFRPDGHVLGGPFYYIERGMGKRWKPLAVLFAALGALAAISGIGTFAQVNSITSAVTNFFDRGGMYMFSIGSLEVSLVSAVAGGVITILAASVILGGIKRIAFVSEIITPVMIVVYLAMTTTMLAWNWRLLPDAVWQVVYGAFCPSAVTGGLIGSMIVAVHKGVARGIFSNESGLGSAPIVAAAAQTNYPVRQGLVSMTGTFIDTIIICTMTGLCVVSMSSWKDFQGVAVTVDAFEKGLPFLGDGTVSFLLMISLIFFAFTTTLGWSYYGERCLDYLVSGNKYCILAYRVAYIFAIFISPYMTVRFVWDCADVFNSLMAIPNLIALLALSGVVVHETKEFFAAKRTWVE